MTEDLISKRSKRRRAWKLVEGGSAPKVNNRGSAWRNLQDTLEPLTSYY